MKTQVKICGVANEADYQAAVESAPDAIGFNFWSMSPRVVTAAQVADWTRNAHPKAILKVGVFVNQPLDSVIRIVETARLDVVQLHGQESLEYAEALPVPVWKGIHLDRLPAELDSFPAQAWLVDSGTVEMPGGTGKRVDGERAAGFVSSSRLPVWLAGGLNAGNVEEAIRSVRPFGVDVCSGVESSPGLKDLNAVRLFIRTVRTM